MKDDLDSILKKRTSDAVEQRGKRTSLHIDEHAWGEMHAQLSDREIERAKRLGVSKTYLTGEFLFEAGQACAGMLIVLKGSVRITYRDGLGQSLDEIILQPGQFLAEVGRQAGRRARVD